MNKFTQIVIRSWFSVPFVKNYLIHRFNNTEIHNDDKFGIIRMLLNSKTDLKTFCNKVEDETFFSEVFQTTVAGVLCIRNKKKFEDENSDVQYLVTQFKYLIDAKPELVLLSLMEGKYYDENGVIYKNVDLHFNCLNKIFQYIEPEFSACYKILDTPNLLCREVLIKYLLEFDPECPFTDWPQEWVDAKYETNYKDTMDKIQNFFTQTRRIALRLTLSNALKKKYPVVG